MDYVKLPEPSGRFPNTKRWLIFMRNKIALVLAGIMALGGSLAVSGKSAPLPQRKALKKEYDAGNFKVAYDGYRQLCLDANDDPAHVGEDMGMAASALQQLAHSTSSTICAKRRSASTPKTGDCFGPPRKTVCRMRTSDSSSPGSSIAVSIVAAGKRSTRWIATAFERCNSRSPPCRSPPPAA